MYDVLIRQGTVIDGTGAPGYRADVALAGGKIAKIAHSVTDAAARTLDAEGLVVCPGFVDMHSHSDQRCLFNNGAANYLEQGITTEVMGQCGISVIPFDEAYETEIRSVGYGVPEEKLAAIRAMRSAGDFLDLVDRYGNGTNVALLMAHGAIRRSVMGMENRIPTAAEMRAMKDILARGMREGARGMSTGLIYPPGVYSTTEELVELAGVAASYGGMYVSHMRNESDEVDVSVREVMRIGREAKIPVHVSHIKVCNKANWGRSGEILGLLDYANKSGIEMTADQYPYTGGSTNLANLLPPRHAADGKEALRQKLQSPELREVMRRELLGLEGAGWENFFLNAGPENILISSNTLEELRHPAFLAGYARERGMDAANAMFDILVRDMETRSVIFMLDEADIEAFMRHPYVMGGTDGRVQLKDGMHNIPRSFATFPRIIGTYCRDRRLMRLEECIRKQTSLPASRARLHGKGALKQGLDADLTIFDYAAIKDNSWFDNHEARNEGIHYVIVNGGIAVENGVATGEIAGRAIRWR